MTIPADAETPVSATDVVSVPASGPTASYCVAAPPRLRNDRSCGLVSADPQYAASQPHGWRAISSSTLNGIRAPRSAAKYQASAGTSYCASQLAPASMTNGLPATAVMRSRNWYGGPGSRAMTRSLSNTRYGSPNAADGSPLENARM